MKAKLNEMLTEFDHIQMIRDTMANRETVQQQRNPTTTYRLPHRMVVRE